MNRREFLVGSGALVVGACLPWRARGANLEKPLEPNAFVCVFEDGKVRVTIPKSEMGQGVQTSLPMLVAEELDVDLAAITVETADADKKYLYGAMSSQITGGSTSVRSSWEPLRKAGAQARAMLVAAAGGGATEGGFVIKAGEKIPYGKLVKAAAALPIPSDVKLKDPKDFRLIGKSQPRIDTPSKTNGTAIFGIDQKQPLTAVVERCPVFGGKVAKYSAARVKNAKVVPISSGIAVVADGYWPAMQGRKALDVTWDEGPNADLSSEKIWQIFEEAGKSEGAIARHEGDARDAIAKAAHKVSAIYRTPFLAHAPMEPLNCTVVVENGVCHVTAPTQAQTKAQHAAAEILNLPPEKVHIHTTLLGGGFGRRAEADFVIEAVEIAKAVNAPVRLVWSREDEIQHGYYRPAEWSRLEAGLDADGWPIAWWQRIVSPSIFSRVFPKMVKNGIDRAAVEGSGAELPYQCANVHVDYVMKEVGVPVGFWRSVGHSSNGFITESFVDELAAVTKKDPFEFRRKLAPPRERSLLELVAAKADWGKPLKKGMHRGIALHASFGSLVAQVAEISVEHKDVRVHRVVCAVDCGQVVNPDTIEAQMQGGIAFGLGAALHSEITLERGRVKQSNFHDYEVLRMNEMPKVEVHLANWPGAPIGGVGEPGVPPIAPAVGNAYFAATGKRLRALPFSRVI